MGNRLSSPEEICSIHTMSFANDRLMLNFFKENMGSNQEKLRTFSNGAGYLYMELLMKSSKRLEASPVVTSVIKRIEAEKWRR